MGSVTTGRFGTPNSLVLVSSSRCRSASLSIGYTVAILQTDGCWRDASSRQWDACRPICGRFVVAAPAAPPRSGSSRAPGGGRLPRLRRQLHPAQVLLAAAGLSPTPTSPPPWRPSTPRRVGRAFGWLERVRQARRVDRGAARRPGFDPGEASRAVQRVAEARTRGAKTEAVAAPDATLRELWPAEARAGGWDPEAIARRVLAGGGPDGADGADDADGPRDPDHGPPAAGPQSVAALAGPAGRPGARADHAHPPVLRVDALAALADALPTGAASIAEIEQLCDRVLAEPAFVPLPAPGASAGSAGERRQLAAGHMRAAVLAAERVVLAAAAASTPAQDLARVAPGQAEFVSRWSRPAGLSALGRAAGGAARRGHFRSGGGGDRRARRGDELGAAARACPGRPHSGRLRTGAWPTAGSQARARP